MKNDFLATVWNIIGVAGLLFAALAMIQCGGGGDEPAAGVDQLNLNDIVLGSGHTRQTYTGVPNDPLVPGLSYLRPAWKIEVGDPSVVVAVIDTGADWTHPDLRDVIWINHGEDINGDGKADQSDLDGIDNDGNGYVDDIIGWDFVRNDNNPMDTNGHGTELSGVITTTANNGIGITGCTWNCPIMPIRVRSSMETDYRIVAKGVLYAIENGAKVINLSLGGHNMPPQVLKEAIEQAYANGILIVAAAGNENTSATLYPGGYPEIMAVAAVDSIGRKKSYSNYGSWVEISASPDRITTFLGGGYDRSGGTSLSTPCVAALGALLFSHYSDLTNVEVREIIKNTADSTDQVNPHHEGMLGAGKINFYRALRSRE